MTVYTNIITGYTVTLVGRDKIRFFKNHDESEWAARCFAAETSLALYEAAEVVEHPKLLWVDPTGVDELSMYVGHASATMDYLNMDVAYIRKDIPDARIAKLRKALVWISLGPGYNETKEEAVLEMMRVATEAVGETK
jgi:hypothetical protein